MAELRLAVVLLGMLTFPGWALLALRGTWRQWKGLQRWIVAVGVSVALYPVLFYGTRAVLPFLTWGPYKIGAVLLACAAVVGWRVRGHWKELFSFDWLEWVAIGVFGMSLFIRCWIIRDHPYPAWSDSLHHTLLTQLTAAQGKLPFDLEPYFPIPLGQYHLGLYSLSASVQWLAQVPAHTALLWTAQVLNGLCGLGVYLVLDRKAGRLGAVVGAAVVGLLSHQPAFYVNWGRFTQAASQAILLIAWLVTWEAIALWRQPWKTYKIKIVWNTVIAAVLSGAVFLFHFRVAAFYMPLLIISIVWELWRARRVRQATPVVLGTMTVGIVVLIVVMPALWESMRTYLTTRLNPPPADPEQVSQTLRNYYEFPWSVVPHLVAYQWLIILALIGLVIGLIRRTRLIMACLIWVIVLYFIGNAYLLGIWLLDVTNLGAVLIMFYLPIGLIVGSAVVELSKMVRSHWREPATRLLVALVLFGGFVASHVRVTEIEPFRHFITPADLAAMDWIEQNTPPDARFAVNTYFWLPGAPHGTDAGYWIPYLTERRTTVGVMLNFLGPAEYQKGIVEMSRAAEQLEIDDTSLKELQALGVDYVYAGQRGDFSGPGLNVTRLSQSKNASVLYQHAGVTIFRINPSSEAD